jgi:ankyrin repeat protein
MVINEFLLYAAQYEEATSTNPRTFACNRFDRNDIRRNKMVDMLSVLLAQILGHIPSVTGSSLTYISRRFIKDRSWTIHDLLHAFEHWRLESEIKAVSCVINNFDQCEQVSRKVFLDLFSCLSKTQERPWRVLVASSEPETLSDQLSQWPVLDMDVTRPDSGELDDIDRISVKTQCSSPTVLEQRPDLYFCQSLLNDELKTLATLEPQTRDLVLQYVCGNQDWPTRQTLSDILGPIKAMTIDTVLERILDNVADPGFAFTALSWILYSMRPPTFWELATVLLVRLKPDGEQCLITSPEFVNEVVTKVKRWLGGIVVVDQHEFHLSTANIRNILLKWPKAIGGKSQLWHGHSEMILAQTAHAQLAMICLDHLSQTAARRTTNIPSVSSSNNLIDSMACGDRTKLCDYATRYWVHHFSCASASPKTQASLQMFMQSAALSPWSVAYWKLANPFTRSEGPFKSIYPILAGLGVPEKVETWQQGDKDISAAVVEAYLNGFPEAARGLLPRIRHATKSLQHALIAAGSVGEELAWRELIEHIAASYPEFPWSTLQVSRAAWWGFDKIISRLLDLGCPVGEQLPEKSTDHTTNASKSGKIVAEDLETDIEENISTEQVLGPIWAATRTGQSKAVKVLVQHGANILRRDPDGYTLLAIAAVYGHSQVLPLLVRAGAFVDEPDPRYLTSLYSACLYGLPECARILLELGANPDLKVVEDQSQEGWCPLAGAADGGYVECVRVLLHGKANPNVTGHRGTPLRYAVCDGSVEICRLLLENGADPNHSSIEPPILHLATGIREHKKKIEVLKVLVEAQANIDALDVHKSTALHWACLSKDPDDIELITYLLDHGASVNAEDRYGRTPLHYVTETGLLDVVRLLLDRGADPNAHLPGEYTPLMPAIQGNHIGIVRMLVQHGADVDPPVENDRWGPTEYAAKYGHAEVLKVLADSGADVNRRFGRARCPLVQLALDGSALGALLEFRPALDVMDEDGDFPLHSLRSDTPLENVKLLVRAGSDLNLTDRSGCTYLSLSLIRGCKEIVEYLICKNADVNPLSPRYGGALHIACGKRMVDMVKRLVEKGAKVNAAVTGLLGTPLQSIILKEGEPQVSGSKAEDDAVISIIEYLLDSGADINTPGGMLGSVTNAAAWQASGRVLKYLLSNEARVVVSDGMGRQPVHLATLRGLDHFNIILDADADIRPRDKAGRTILHWAAQGGHLAVLERVLQLTGDDTVNEIDIDGWTPLCWAARGCGSGYEPGPDGGQATIVKELIRRGANIYVKSQIAGKEWTPASIAEYHGCSREVIKLLTLPSDAKEGESSKGDGDVSLTSSNILPKGKRLRAWPDAFCDMCLFVSDPYLSCDDWTPLTSIVAASWRHLLCLYEYNMRTNLFRPLL